MALAALDGLHQYADADTATHDGGWQRANAAAYFAPDGILLRGRLMCCGVFDRGNVFRAAGDTKWWRDSFRFAKGFWDVLGVYAKLDVDPDGEPSMHFDEDIARADPGALTQAIVKVQQDDLPHFTTSKCEPPYLWPLVAGIPIPNAKCAPIPDPSPLVPRIPSIPWWAWVLLGYFLLGDDNKRR